MTVYRPDANHFLVAIGIADSSVKVDSCYVPGLIPVLGDSILRVQQREASIDSPGIAIQLFQIKHPGSWTVPVRVHLTGPADFAWGVITMNGVVTDIDPTGTRHTAKGLGVYSVGQNAIAGPNFFWATMEKPVVLGTGVTVLGSKTDLRGSSKAFSILRKTTESWTPFSYSQTVRAPLAAGGVEVSLVYAPEPPNPGPDEVTGRRVLGWIHP